MTRRKVPPLAPRCAAGGAAHTTYATQPVGAGSGSRTCPLVAPLRGISSVYSHPLAPAPTSAYPRAASFRRARAKRRRSRCASPCHAQRAQGCSFAHGCSRWGPRGPLCSQRLRCSSARRDAARSDSVRTCYVQRPRSTTVAQALNAQGSTPHPLRSPSADDVRCLCAPLPKPRRGHAAPPVTGWRQSSTPAPRTAVHRRVQVRTDGPTAGARSFFPLSRPRLSLLLSYSRKAARKWPSEPVDCANCTVCTK